VLDREARVCLIGAGYDMAMGARPLRRAIEQNVENVLAEEFLKGSLGGADTIDVTAEGGRLVFRPRAAGMPARAE
jgi:ATP-dependent Clp protease ATP-binding subunit ClpA